MAEYICVRKCFFQGQLFAAGEELSTKSEVNEHFKLKVDLENVVDVESEEVKTENIEAPKLEALRKQYFEKFKKEVPVNMKNNVDWIAFKLAE